MKWEAPYNDKPIFLESADAEISYRHRRQNAISCSGLYMSVRVSRILIKFTQFWISISAFIWYIIRLDRPSGSEMVPKLPTAQFFLIHPDNLAHHTP